MSGWFLGRIAGSSSFGGAGDDADTTQHLKADHALFVRYGDGERWWPAPIWWEALFLLYHWIDSLENGRVRTIPHRKLILERFCLLSVGAGRSSSESARTFHLPVARSAASVRVTGASDTGAETDKVSKSCELWSRISASCPACKKTLSCAQCDLTSRSCGGCLGK